MQSQFSTGHIVDVHVNFGEPVPYGFVILFQEGFWTLRRQYNGGRFSDNTVAETSLSPKRPLKAKNQNEVGGTRITSKRGITSKIVQNLFITFPLLIWGHKRCMHALPHRRKYQRPLQSLRDLRSR